MSSQFSLGAAVSEADIRFSVWSGSASRLWVSLFDADGDRETQLVAARAWSVWEGVTSSLLPNPERTGQFGKPEFAHALARIEAHYFANQGFFSGEDQSRSSQAMYPCPMQ